jgi:hypothetical protein
MNEHKTFKDLVNSILSPAQKETFAKAFKFETPIPVVEPVNNAVPETVPPVAGEIKTKDGTVVKYSTPMPIPNETIVTVVTPDGELPAPAGDHELENGDIEIGDYITTSSIPGKGMKQSDDLMHNYTVAKARENVTFSSPTEVKLIACTYHCG